MVFLGFYRSAHNIQEGCRRYVGFCPYRSTPSEEQSAHRLPHASNGMLHTALHHRLLTVVLILTIRQSTILGAFLPFYRGQVFFLTAIPNSRIT